VRDEIERIGLSIDTETVGVRNAYRALDACAWAYVVDLRDVFADQSWRLAWAARTRGLNDAEWREWLADFAAIGWVESVDAPRLTERGRAVLAWLHRWDLGLIR
jgi:hypothetical protein